MEYKQSKELFGFLLLLIGFVLAFGGLFLLRELPGLLDGFGKWTVVVGVLMVIVGLTFFVPEDRRTRTPTR